MQTSESIKEIANALLLAQSEITSVVKDSNNPFFNSKYANLSAVIEAVKPALNKNGIVFVQTASTSDRGCAVTTRLIHVSGEWLQDTATCPVAKNDPQGYGSAITYLRRYSLVSITGLEQVDDDGNDGSGLKDEPTNNKPAAPTHKPTVVKDDLAIDAKKVLLDEILALVNKNRMGPTDVFKVVGSDINSIKSNEAALEQALNKLRVATALGAKTV